MSHIGSDNPLFCVMWVKDSSTEENSNDKSLMELWHYKSGTIVYSLKMGELLPECDVRYLSSPRLVNLSARGAIMVVNEYRSQVYSGDHGRLRIVSIPLDKTKPVVLQDIIKNNECMIGNNCIAYMPDSHQPNKMVVLDCNSMKAGPVLLEPHPFFYTEVAVTNDERMCLFNALPQGFGLSGSEVPPGERLHLLDMVSVRQRTIDSGDGKIKFFPVMSNTGFACGIKEADERETIRIWVMNKQL